MQIDLAILVVMNGIMILSCLYFAIFVYPGREWCDETKRRPRSFISNAFFREFWYYLIGPMKRQLIRWNVQPNTITIVGFVFSILAGISFALEQFGIGGWFVILAATCDIYDGMLAREKNISLKSGAFLDSTLDRVGEVAIFYGLARYFRGDDLWFAAIFLAFAASQVVSYSRARAEGLGFAGDRGFFQRAERMIILAIAMPIVPVLDHFWGSGPVLVKVAVAIVFVGSFSTAVSRTVGIFKEIERSEVGLKGSVGSQSSAAGATKSAGDGTPAKNPERTTAESVGSYS
jgi:CDP-diacylglycerol---glycerol-3-phosphate 3-phosphatidyltransferase